MRLNINDTQAASTSAVQAGTDTIRFVSPSTAGYHLAAAVAWCQFTSGGLTTGYNVSSVTRNGAGDYTVNLSVTMASTNYAVQVNHTLQTGNPHFVMTVGALATVSFGALIGQTTSGQEIAGDTYYATAYGIRA